jgi:hypothetical protein
MAIGPSGLANFPSLSSTYTARIPPNGSKVMPYLADLTLGDVDIDLTVQQQQGYIDIVQSVFIDASDCDCSVGIDIPGTRQKIVIPPRHQGFVPMLTPSAPKFSITAETPITTDGIVRALFLNVPMPVAVWPAFTAGLDPATGAQIVTPGPTQDDLSLTTVITVASASTALIAANTGRYFMRIFAPTGGDVWINPTGGTAAVGGAGCFRVPAGSLYETAWNAPCKQACTYFCTVAGLTLNVWTGG